MGREIRRVPPDWEHPKYTEDEITQEWQRGNHRPLFDKDYTSACREWYAKAAEYNANLASVDTPWYHEWNGNPPDAAYYRDRAWTEAEATHYQMYETVSEGTPVSPVFGLLSDLVGYLVTNGDFWDQRRGNGGWGRQAAEDFCASGWAPSGVAVGGMLYTPRDGNPL